MLKRSITYTDFNGDKVTEELYFHLSKSEVVKLNFAFGEDLETVLQRMVKERDVKNVLEMFSEILISSYGIKSDDGKRFIKNDQLREDFKNSAAYDELFIQVFTNETAMAEFISGALPKDISDAVMQQRDQDKPIGPPRPPKPPAVS